MILRFTWEWLKNKIESDPIIYEENIGIDMDYEDWALKKSFKDTLKAVENSVKEGYDSEKKRWFPHKSLEGGTDTLGYGHKLTDQEVADEKIQLDDGSYLCFTKGLTDKEVDVLFDNSFNKMKERTRRQWNKYAGVEDRFEDLDQEYQYVLVNIVYNVGTLVKGGKWVWPKLRNAIITADEPEIYKQMLTSYICGFTGSRIYLEQRRDRIADCLKIDKE